MLAGRYRIDGLLGEGGMGSVFAATELAVDRKVAVKRLAPALANEPEFVARFVREARLLAKFDHPSLVQLLAVDSDDGAPLLVMKYVEGKTLTQVLFERKRFSMRQVLPVLDQLCDALDYLHARGVVHRDLKPSNLMLDDAGRLTVLDFGISQHRDAARLTVPGTLLGTPLYMAPEQIVTDECGPEADLYALALITWHLLVGEHPFGGPEDGAAALMSLQVHATPALAHRANPAVPALVARVIDRSLNKVPDARHPTAKAFYEDLVLAFGQDITEGVRDNAGPIPQTPHAAPSSRDTVADGPSARAVRPDVVTAPAPRRSPWWLAPLLGGLLVAALLWIALR